MAGNGFARPFEPDCMNRGSESNAIKSVPRRCNRREARSPPTLSVSTRHRNICATTCQYTSTERRQDLPAEERGIHHTRSTERKILRLHVLARECRPERQENTTTTCVSHYDYMGWPQNAVMNYRKILRLHVLARECRHEQQENTTTTCISQRMPS